MLSCQNKPARIQGNATDIDKAVFKDASQSVDTRVQDLLSYMTLEEKVGQMTQVDRQFLESEADIAKYYLGSLLSGGGSVPEPNAPPAWVEMIDRYQKIALSTRLGVPLIYGIDAIHGNNNVVGATISSYYLNYIVFDVIIIANSCINY